MDCYKQCILVYSYQSKQHINKSFCNKNTGVERTATITVKHDTDTVTVTVTQNKSVYYQRDMILFSLQETSDGCAITCAAMCMKKTLKQFQEDGLPIEGSANWLKMANTYGYTVSPSDPPGYSSDSKKVYDEILNYLKSGYPVIITVNQNNTHWLVVTDFIGDPNISSSKYNADYYICADPARNGNGGNNKKLSNAYEYNSSGPRDYLIYKK